MNEDSIVSTVVSGVYIIKLKMEDTRQPSHQPKLQFQTLLQTRKYFWKQRTILFGFFIVNMLRPYGTPVLPLFVLAGSRAVGLETVFLEIVLIIGLLMWRLMQRISHSYPKECACQGGKIINYRYKKHYHHQQQSEDNQKIDLLPKERSRSDSRSLFSRTPSSARSVQNLQEAGKVISAPSLLKCICFLEGWREAKLVKRVTCITLFSYSIYLVVLYLRTILHVHNNTQAQSEARRHLMSEVSPFTVVVLYLSFLITLYSLFSYESPFFEEMVSNPIASETFLQDRQDEIDREDNERKSKQEQKRRSSRKRKSIIDRILNGNSPETEEPNELEIQEQTTTPGGATPTSSPSTDNEKQRRILELYEQEKNGFFHDITILTKLFTTSFPDECFPLHLRWMDIFCSSTDLLIQLQKCAAVVDYY